VRRSAISRLRVVAVRLASTASLGVVLIGGWFTMMEMLLRHDGYAWRVGAAAIVIVEGALTIAVLEELITAPVFRGPLTLGAIATAFLGWWIVVDDLSRPGLPARPHFEGYLLIVGVALIGYGALTIVAIFTAQTVSDTA